MPRRACSRCDTTGKTLADYRKYSISGLSTPSRKNICLSEIHKSCFNRAVPPRHEGRDGHSSPDVRRDAMDAWRRKTCGAMRTVKPCGPGPPTLGSSEWRWSIRDGGYQARYPEESAE